jgi:guanylate kinase
VPGPPVLVVLTGPSGAGKDTVLDQFRGRPGCAVAVNATTRPPRPGEEDGVDYFFVSKEEFQRMVRDGELLEHAVVYGQDKGVPREPIRRLLAQGLDVMLRTDIQGARYIKSVVPGAITVFVAPPSEDELERRMRARGGDSPEQVAIRLATAREEMRAASEFDHIVVNDNLDLCVKEVERIIALEKARADREPLRV